ncbi:MAG: endonuclease, partial [Bacteroidota bacterium]
LFSCSLLSAQSTSPPANLYGQSFRNWVKQNWFDGYASITQSYTGARLAMYNDIDNDNGTVSCVYSGYQRSIAPGSLTVAGDAMPINAEHTIPQSFFNQASPMRVDIHHLFPTYANWNSTRSNHPFTDIPDNQTSSWMRNTTSQSSIPTSNIDEYSEFANNTFEPREDHKGNVARAIFYFYTVYPSYNIAQVGDVNELYQWHLNDPVDASESQRNNEIAAFQGNRNPYISNPSWVFTAWIQNAPGGGGSCSSTISSFPYTEGFEGSFSAWTQNSDDDLDWTKRSGNTPSSSTGPSAAAAGNFYLYVEASSPNYPSKEAVLSSACFNLASLGNPEVNFQYHMYGANMGSLNLQAKTSSGSWTTIWSQSGDQGNSWEDANVSLSAYAGQTIELRFFGTTGSSYRGDMAIDDFSVENASSTPPSCATTINSFPYTEGFESASFSWTNASGDDLDWSRRSGSTPSSNTGPSSANAGSFYLYVEASSPNFPSKTTILQSPCFNLSGLSNPSFSFAHHLYGAAMGSLSLQAKSIGGNWTTIWSLSGNQGNSWGNASVSLNSFAGQTIQLQFIGTTGSSYTSDMAIDALSLSAGSTGGGGCTDVTVTIVTDNYPSETTWQLNGGSGTITGGGPYSVAGNTYTKTVCLDDGCYTFRIDDSYGDGICCSFGNGSYEVRDENGNLLASGGNFGSTESTNFCLPASNRQAFIAEEDVELRIFPNPAQDVLNLRFNMGEPAEVGVQVIDMMGKVQIMDTNIANTGEQALKVSLTNLSSGQYVLQLIIPATGEIISKKFSVVR